MAFGLTRFRNHRIRVLALRQRPELEPFHHRQTPLKSEEPDFLRAMHLEHGRTERRP